MHRKYLILCSAEERNAYRFGMTYFWVNYPIKPYLKE